MQFENISFQLSQIIDTSLSQEDKTWLSNKIEHILTQKSGRELFLTYSMLSSKIDKTPISDFPNNGDVVNYITLKNGNLQEVTRIYLLAKVLEQDEVFFSEKVAKLIEVADINEQITFLKFLILLPNPEKYKLGAVESLRTNVGTIFGAIAYNNPYPGLYFNEQQWNQMYLKTIFIGGDLGAILDVDARANKELARIISDYAHERWAASRDIDPVFWRPVSNFIEGALVEDIKRLLSSKNISENRAAALCCIHSNKAEAKKLLNNYPDLLKQATEKAFAWTDLN